MRNMIYASAACLTLATFVTSAPVVAVAAEVEWRLNISQVETRPGSRMAARFADRVTEKSGGRMVIKPYFGDSLGFGQSDTLRALKSGTVEMSSAYAGYFARDAPDVASALPQGMILAAPEMVAILPVMKDIYEKAYAKWDIVTVGWINESVFDISVFCKDKVDGLQAMKGKKLRVWAKDQVDTFARLGVPAQIVPQNELYLALQTGVIDCALYPAAIAKTISLQEVTRFAVKLHAYSALPSALGVAKRHWEKLPKDLQAIVLEAGEWVSVESQKFLLDTADEERGKAEISATGKFQFLGDMPKADQDAFYKAASDVWAERVRDVGREAPAYRERVMKGLQEFRDKRS